MTDSSDDSLNMTDSFLDRRKGLGDQTLDELFGADSRPQSAQFEGVAVLLTDLRALIDAPAPPPNTELAQMMALGLPATSANLAPILDARRTARQRLRRTGLALGLSAVVSFPLAGLAAAKDLLPTWMDDAITTVIEAITPFHLSDSASGTEGDPGSGLGEGRAKVVRDRQGPSTPPTQHPGGAASEGTGTSAQLPRPKGSTPTGTTTSDPTGSETKPPVPPASSPIPTSTATTAPAPVTTTATTAPAPVSTTSPASGATTAPAPVPTTSPASGATTEPTPTFTTTTDPEPVATTEPAPTFRAGEVPLDPGTPTTASAPKVGAYAPGSAP